MDLVRWSIDKNSAYRHSPRFCPHPRMGLFSRIAENKAQQREVEKQRLITLSEKELLVEILIELKELNEQSEKIKRNQVIWGD